MKPTAYDCAETIRRLNDFLDRELSADEVAMVEAHLAECVHCASEFGFEAALLHEIKRKIAARSMPVDLKRRLQTLLDQARDS